MSRCVAWCEKVHPWAEVPLRIVFSLIFIAHGGQKLFGWLDGPGITGFTGLLNQLGFAGAGFWSWVVGLVEFGGGILVLLGLLTPLAAGLIGVVMVVAIFKVHVTKGLLGAGGYEYPLMLFAVALSLMLSGAHKFALDAMWEKKKQAPPPGARPVM